MTGYDAGVWIGLLAPAGTSEAIVAKLSAAANEALKAEAVRTALKAQGTDIVGGGQRNLPISSVPTSRSGRAVLAASGKK